MLTGMYQNVSIAYWRNYESFSFSCLYIINILQWICKNETLIKITTPQWVSPVQLMYAYKNTLKEKNYHSPEVYFYIAYPI
jgi:hypothetical protein